MRAKVRVTVLGLDQGARGIATNLWGSDTYISPERVDSITVIPESERSTYPEGVRSIIRYVDEHQGYRFLLVAEEARAIRAKLV